MAGTTLKVAAKVNNVVEQMVLCDEVENLAYIPRVGDNIACFGRTGTVTDQLLAYFPDGGLEVLLNVEIQKTPKESNEIWAKLGCAVD